MALHKYYFSCIFCKNFAVLKTS